MSAIEIRDYDGDGRDLAEMIERVWRANYGGKVRFPLWDLPYLEWRLLDPRGGGRDYLVCAYQGDKLVACLLAEPLDFEVGGRAVRATMSSWLSVDPDVRAPGLPMRLVEGLRERQERDGISFSMGYASSDPDHAARKFWNALAKRRGDDVVFFRPLTFWGRTFRPGAVSASALDRFERYAPWLTSNIPWAYTGWRPRRGVRPYNSKDLERCRDWIHAASEGVHLRHIWSRSRLEIQLGHPYARSLVLERGPRGGILNYYPIRHLGASEIRVGMIDVLAGDTGLAGTVGLLKAAGHQMMTEGLDAAFMMETAATPRSALLAAGFVPFSPALDALCLFPEAQLGIRPGCRFDALFG